MRSTASDPAKRRLQCTSSYKTQKNIEYSSPRMPKLRVRLCHNHATMTSNLTRRCQPRPACALYHTPNTLNHIKHCYTARTIPMHTTSATRPAMSPNRRCSGTAGCQPIMYCPRQPIRQDPRLQPKPDHHLQSPPKPSRRLLRPGTSFNPLLCTPPQQPGTVNSNTHLLAVALKTFPETHTPVGTSQALPRCT